MKENASKKNGNRKLLLIACCVVVVVILILLFVTNYWQNERNVFEENISNVEDLQVENLQVEDLQNDMISSEPGKNNTLATFIAHQFSVDGKNYICNDNYVKFFELNEDFEEKQQVEKPVFASTKFITLNKANSRYYCYLLNDGRIVFAAEMLWSWNDFTEVKKVTDINIAEIVNQNAGNYEEYVPVTVYATYIDNQKYLLGNINLIFECDGEYYKAPEGIKFYSKSNFSEENVIQNPVFISPTCRRIISFDECCEIYCYLTVTGTIVFSDSAYTLKPVYE